MKKTFLFVSMLMLTVVVFESSLQAQGHELIKKWQTDSVLKVPESVLFDEANKILYTSNIDGTPDGKDGKGSIGKVGLDGKIIEVDWVKGLNAPKGLGKFNNLLYAADVDEVAVIDISAGTIKQHIPVEGATFLNDITVDKNGVVYVSDSKTGKVHRIDNGKVSTYLENLKGPNGLLAMGDDLYILASGTLWKADKNKQLTKIADEMDPSTDGVENVKGNEFIVSCWAGVIYYIKSDGTKQQLIDTRPLKINSADIGYDAKNRIVYIPTFFKNSIAAYNLQ